MPEPPPDNKIQSDIVYYYSRERRLSKASPGVQALNDGKPVRPSLSKTIFATKSNKLVFTTIILVLIISGLAFRFTKGKNDGFMLGGNVLVMNMRLYDGMPVLEIVKNVPQNGEFYIGPVNVTVSPVISKSKARSGEEGGAGAAFDNAIFNHGIYFNPVETETFRTAIPFEGNDFIVVLEAGYEQKSLRIKPKK